MIQAGVDRVAIYLNDFYEDELGSEKFKLHILVDKEDEYMKGKYVKTGAEIAGLPTRVSKRFEEFLPLLISSSHVYFDYKSLEEDEFVKDSEGRKVYFVPLKMVFCGTDEVSDTQRVFPNIGITLCKPFYGFGFEKANIEPFGERVVKFSKAIPGMVSEMDPDPDERIAEVAHADIFSSLSEGDLVFREPKTNYEYEIAGEKFYVVPTKLILGRFKGTSFGHTITDDVRDEYHYDIDATEMTFEEREKLNIKI